MSFAAIAMVRHMSMPPLIPFEIYPPPAHDRQ
jgi:hypothetical protein